MPSFYLSVLTFYFLIQKVNMLFTVNYFALGALTLLVGLWEGYSACENLAVGVTVMPWKRVSLVSPGLVEIL